MTNKLLSVKDAADILCKNILDACFDSEDILSLISAVRREEREKLICSECGFPPEIKREPVFLDSNPLSFLKYEDNKCEKCGCQKDGSTIPVVAKKIREVAEHVQKRERERIITIVNDELINPYSPEVFIEKTAAEWKKFHIALANDGILGDGYLGSVARLGYSTAINDMKKKILEEK